MTEVSDSRTLVLVFRWASVSGTSPATVTIAASASGDVQPRGISSSRSPTRTAEGLPLTSTPPRTTSRVCGGGSAVPGALVAGGPPAGWGAVPSGGGPATLLGAGDGAVA